MNINTAFANTDQAQQQPVETHPWPPFIPENARVLFLGTFPPAPSRWCMPFYYPNRINDFWRITGLAFYEDREHFYDAVNRTFRLKEITDFCTERGIAFCDTGHKVRRLRGNAADAFLEIVEPVDLKALLALMPDCRALATTGTLASQVLAGLTDSKIPKIGESVEAPGLVNAHGSPIAIWRLPSTSRAYPLPIEKKTEQYIKLYRSIGLLT